MRSKLLISFVIFLFFTVNSIFASHDAAGMLKYEHVSGNQYYVKVSLVRDCNGVQYSTYNMPLKATCTITYDTTSAVLSHIPFVAPAPKFGGPYSALVINSGAVNLYVQEITNACDSILNPAITPNSSCRNGTSPIQGFTLYNFGSLITLPACENWKISASPVCCRNNQGANHTSSGMTLQSSLNNMAFSDNSSPLSDPARMLRYDACIGVEGRFPFTMIDPDGDSLTYSLSCPLQSSFPTGNVCITFSSGFSATLPMGGATLDSTTGVFRFKPVVAGKKTSGVMVNEYDPLSGQWKGSTLLDVQFIVSACNNKPPVAMYGISNISGIGASKIDSFVMVVKEGELVTFEDTIYDPNATDQIIVGSVGGAGIANHSITIDTLATNKIKVSVSWLPHSQTGTQNYLTLKYSDSKCPSPATSYVFYRFDVVPDLVLTGGRLSSRDTVLLMKGDTLNLTTNAYGKPSWTSISGDSFVWSGTGRNAWGDTTAIDTNAQLTFRPLNNTLVSVSGNVKVGNSLYTGNDSIYIKIIPPFKIKITLDSNFCLFKDSARVYVTADSNFIYTYKWSSTKGRISPDSVWNPFLSGPSYNDYWVTVTSHYGGERIAKINLGVRKGVYFPRLVADRDTICKGVEVKLQVKSGLNQNQCGLVPTQSFAQPIRNYDTLNTMSSALGNSLFPNPLSGYRKSSKQQYLYRANDLKDVGFKSGIIQSIGFYIDSNSTALNDSLLNYTVKLKCTSDTDLYSFQAAGLVEVASNKTVNLVRGWNRIQFDSGYYWNGNENLLAQICYANNDTIFQIIKTAMKPINYNGNICFYDGTPTCAKTNITPSNFKRIPVTEFGVKNYADTTNFTYTWSAGLIQDTLVKSRASGSPLVTKTHTAILVDTVSYCRDTLQKTIVVIDPKIDLGNDTSLCEGTQYNLTATVDSGVAGEFTWHPNLLFPKGKGTSNNLVLDSTANVWVNFINDYGCSLTDTVKITAKLNPKPSILTAGPFCESSVQDTLYADISGGTFSGVGVTGNNINPTHPLLKPSLTQPKSSQISYSVTVNGCEGDTTVSVDIYPLFDTTYLGKRNFCANDPAELLFTKHQGGTWSGVGIDTTNYFHPNVAGAGNYTISLDSIGFCGNRATYNFVVNNIPTKSISSKSVGCGPYSTHIDAGNPGATYLWSTGDTIQIIQVNAIGDYWVDVTNTDQCVTRDSIRIELIKQCAGVEENTFDNGVKIYPNPVQDILGVYQPSSASNLLRVKLYNSLGSVFYTSSTDDVQLQINVSDFSAGIYFLNVENEKGISTFRIIIE